MRRYTSQKDVNALVNELIGQRWKLVQHRGHLKLFTPDGRLGAVACVSSSDRRAFLNLKTDVKKAKVAYEQRKTACHD